MAAAAGTHDIQLYSLATPNGIKIAWILEELKAAGKISGYDAHTINISAGDQFKPGFLAISPNNKIPGITDAKTGVTIFESGAILQYLADTYGAFFPADVKERAEVNAWLFWSCASLSPILGQVGHFFKYSKEDVPYAKARFSEEAARLLKVLNKQLATSGSGFVCSSGLSIADFTIAPWIERLHKGLKEGPIDWSAYPEVVKYAGMVAELEAYKTACGVTPFPKSA